MTPGNGEGKPYRKPITSLLNRTRPKRILDLACGGGWVGQSLDYPARVHGVDLFAAAPAGYEVFRQADINEGIPDELGEYDCVVCCEAMPYLQNPGLFLSSIRRHLTQGGLFILSLPNPTHVSARLGYLLQGFPRSHSRFVHDETQPHMPWLALGVFQLWLLLGLNGFEQLEIHEVAEKKPKHLWEIPFGAAMKLYCRNRMNKARSEAEQHLWRWAATDQIIYGRQLVVSAYTK